MTNTFLANIEPPSCGTEHILFLSFPSLIGPVTLLSIYAPTLWSTSKEKDAVYEELERIIGNVFKSDHLYLFRDFNARFGGNHDSWPRVVGHFGVGKLSENGQRLLELCCKHDLCIRNTFFNTKPFYRFFGAILYKSIGINSTSSLRSGLR